MSRMIRYSWSVGDDDDANGGGFSIKEGHDWPELIDLLAKMVKIEGWIDCTNFTITCHRPKESESDSASTERPSDKTGSHPGEG